MAELVASAIAKEEALERVVKAYQRRVLADADYAKRRHQIDLKLGEQFKSAMKTGLTAKQISRAIGLSIPRIYQLRNLYNVHLSEEFGTQ